MTAERTLPRESARQDYERILQTSIGLITFMALLKPLSAPLDSIGHTLSPALAIPLLIFSYVLLTWFSILVHEIGHASAAALIGWRIHAIVVPLFAYYPKRKRWESRSLGRFRVAGFVLATPGQNGSWRASPVVVSGGCIANFILAAAVPALMVNEAVIIREIASSLSAVSLAIGVVNLLPIRYGDFRSDGAKLIDHFRHIENPGAEPAARLLGSDFDGVSPHDWNDSDVRQLETELDQGPNLRAGTSLLYFRYVARGQYSRARLALEVLVESYGSRPPQWITVERALLFSLLDRDHSKSKALLSTVSRSATKTYAYWRAMAVVSDAHGDGDLAFRAAHYAEELARKHGFDQGPIERALLSAICAKRYR